VNTALFQFDNTRGRVYMDDEGAIWWDPQTGRPPELLADQDSLCGVFPFETGVDDVFRDCCSAHDHFYTNRAEYEAWGYDREWMDAQFYTYMRDRACDDIVLQKKAKCYYTFVRMFGWIFYYRHPGAKSHENVAALLAQAMPAKAVRRKYGWKPDVPDQRDYLYKLVRPVGETLPPRVDLREWVGEILDQGQLGSCTAHALAEAHMFVQRQQAMRNALQQLFLPSRLFIYYNERAMEGSIDSDSGAAIRDGIKSLISQGACPEALWDYDRDFRIKPSTQAYQEAEKHVVQQYLRVTHLQSLKHSIFTGWPVVFGFAVYQSFESNEVARTGVVPIPEAHE